jgi:hypothetical protein
VARGAKSSYSSKQKRQAADIEKSYKKRGVSSKTAEARAWATVNKQTGGAAKKKSASKKSAAKKPATKKPSAKKSMARRKTAAKKTSHDKK